MTGVKFISPEQAAAIVSDDSTVGLVGLLLIKFEDNYVPPRIVLVFQ